MIHLVVDLFFMVILSGNICHCAETSSRTYVKSRTRSLESDSLVQEDTHSPSLILLRERDEIPDGFDARKIYLSENTAERVYLNENIKIPREGLTEDDGHERLFLQKDTKRFIPNSLWLVTHKQAQDDDPMIQKALTEHYMSDKKSIENPDGITDLDILYKHTFEDINSIIMCTTYFCTILLIVLSTRRPLAFSLSLILFEVNLLM